MIKFEMKIGKELNTNGALEYLQGAINKELEETKNYIVLEGFEVKEEETVLKVETNFPMVLQVMELIQKAFNRRKRFMKKFEVEVKETVEINNIELPVEVKEEIKDILKAYDKCNVVFESGKYSVRTGYCLQKEYSKDYKFIGEFAKDDVFTKREQVINYIEEFRSFPSEYKIERNSYLELGRYNNGEIALNELVAILNI